MELVELTSPPSEALPLAALKSHLRTGSGFSADALQDELLEAFVRAAIASIEPRIGKVLLTRELEWHIERWTESDRQPLPVAPVSTVVGVSLITLSGELSAVPPDRYKLARDTHRPQIVSAAGGLPTIPTGGAAAIHFFAGYGTAWSDIPVDLRQAVLLLAAHFYENREAAEGAGEAMPFGVTSLLEPYRTIRLFGARS